jgi:hypothetical protein
MAVDAFEAGVDAGGEVALEEGGEVLQPKG